MTLLTRWEPFRELASLQDRISLQERLNRLFGQMPLFDNEESLAARSFVPPVDVYEDEHGIQLRMEVPGVEEKDIDVRLENNLLTVRGERKLSQETKEENYHRVERRYGSFSRSFTLPNTVNPENVKAGYDRGVLTLRLAKKAEAKPRQIKVNVESKTLEATAK